MSTVKDEASEAIWAVSDGRAGLRNQVLGLAEAVARLSPRRVVEVTVDLARPWVWLPPQLAAWEIFGLPFSALRAERPLAPPWPRLIIGCGRKSIPLSLAIRRRSKGGTFTVQTQDPRISPALFDLVVPPLHDALEGANVFPIVGSPNRIHLPQLGEAAHRLSPSLTHLPAPRVAVLIGGSSKHYHLSEAGAAGLADALAPLVQTGTSLLVTTSRRTGPQQTRVLKERLEAPNVWFWDGESDNPYFGLLGLADFILVTADSVNMATEAAATGKPIYILPVTGGAAKFTTFHRTLTERGIARPFEGSLQHFSYAPLKETERAAREIAKRANLP